MNEWEDVSDRTHRLKVFHGWYVRYDVWDSGPEFRIGVSTEFIHDPYHEWVVGENETKEHETVEQALAEIRKGG